MSQVNYVSFTVQGIIVKRELLVRTQQTMDFTVGLCAALATTVLKDPLDRLNVPAECTAVELGFLNLQATAQQV